MHADNHNPLPETTPPLHRENTSTQPPCPTLPQTLSSSVTQPSSNRVNADPPNNLDKDRKPETEEVKSDQAAETKPQESPPLAPDLNSVYQEIDQYILTLSTVSQRNGSFPPNVPIFLEQFAVLVESKVADYDSAGNSHIKWNSLTEEASASFLQATTRLTSLSEALLRFSRESKYAYTINRVGGVLQWVMSYMEEEFKSLLEDYQFPNSNPAYSTETKPTSKQSLISSLSKGLREQNPPDQSQLPAEDKYFPGYSQQILSELIRLSKVLMAGGHDLECFRLFFIARKNALGESLHRLGFEKYSMEDLQKMQWELLEREILAWIRTMKQCAGTQFCSEHKLLETVLSGHPKIYGSLFCSLSHGVMTQLLNFAQAVALTKRAVEKLFRFLDMYETLRDVLFTIDGLFPEDWTMTEVKTETSVIKARLGDAMVSIFGDLEHSIKADSGKTCVPGGAIHPLTRYTMNYLRLACEYTETLDQVFAEHITKIKRANLSSDTGSDLPNVNSQNANVGSPFQNEMIKMMDILNANLEGKSKLYKDLSLSTIFMMNNGRYILQKIQGSSETNKLMGAVWCKKKSSEIMQYHKEYQCETWGKLLKCFHPDGLVSQGKVMKPVLKERFKSFNAMFEDIHKIQSGWVVSDLQLRMELRVSISNMVIPAYRSFLGRYSQVFTPGRQTGKYVKYQPEDIETCIEDLFDGNATALIGRKKSIKS